ncbi:hypothetical protein RYH80_09420 [Halobaculum sp. MBLA0147]|uniref:hypothetical protein n=1 Tax=Halobaculum sp. MBLA0147 TaxID=3079934 RepID=UPI003526507C
MNLRTEPDRLVAIDQARQSATVALRPDEADTDDVAADDLYADRSLSLRTDRTTAYDTTTATTVETDWVSTPPVGVTVVEPASGTHTQIRREEAVSVGPDTLVVLRTPVLTLLRPAAEGTVRRGERVAVTFPEPTRIAVGFQSTADFAERTVRVTETADGVAAGITALGCAIETTSPDRTWPNIRSHPPALAFVDDDHEQTAAQFETPDTAIEVVVPREDALAYLLPTAPLAHYVGATVRVESGATARLRAGSVEWELGETPVAADQTASRLLRRTFYLDCLARSASPYGDELASHDVLTDAGFQAAQLYDASVAERVQQYLALDEETAERVDEALPAWHLGVHVQPSTTNALSLPHHLSRLADVYSPEAATLASIAERYEWGEQRRVRGAAAEASGPDMWVSPEQRAATVGWEAPRRALGAFNVCGTPRLHPLSETELSITVVQATLDYPGESVADHYEDRDLPLSVSFHRGIESEQLASLMESSGDLLHVIGHHESSAGIECQDGFCSRTTVDECGWEAFFLNACGSYQFAEWLVDRGASAGVATTRTVSNDSAARVGVNWGRLVSLGWSVERALSFARQVDDPSGYVAIGDGAYRLMQSDAPVPAEARVTKSGDDQWEVALTHDGPRQMGIQFTNSLTTNPYLGCSTGEWEVPRDELEEFLDSRDSPVLHDGDLQWDMDL